MTQPKTRHPLFLILKILLLHSVPLHIHLILNSLRLHILGTVGLLLRFSIVKVQMQKLEALLVSCLPLLNVFPCPSDPHSHVPLLS